MIFQKNDFVQEYLGIKKESYITVLLWHQGELQTLIARLIFVCIGPYVIALYSTWALSIQPSLILNRHAQKLFFLVMIHFCLLIQHLKAILFPDNNFVMFALRWTVFMDFFFFFFSLALCYVHLWKVSSWHSSFQQSSFLL